MKRDIATKWTEALRSGKYQQGSGVLRKGSAFCCLGVLCDLHRQEAGGQWVDKDAPGGGLTYVTACGGWDYAMLPTEVANWAGVQSPNPSAAGEWLTHLNDSGRSFTDLADRIDSNWSDL